jgi:hypothetical protein
VRVNVGGDRKENGGTPTPKRRHDHVSSSIDRVRDSRLVSKSRSLSESKHPPEYEDISNLVGSLREETHELLTMEARDYMKKEKEVALMLEREREVDLLREEVSRLREALTVIGKLNATILYMIILTSHTSTI